MVVASLSACGIYDNEETGYREHWVDGTKVWFMHKDLLNGKPLDWPNNKWEFLIESRLFKLGNWRAGQLIFGTRMALPKNHPTNTQTW